MLFVVYFMIMCGGEVFSSVENWLTSLGKKNLLGLILETSITLE